MTNADPNAYMRAYRERKKAERKVRAGNPTCALCGDPFVPMINWDRCCSMTCQEMLRQKDAKHESHKS